MTSYLLVNFGGPRSLSEIEPFLSALLTDRDVVESILPRWFFRKIAKWRAKSVGEQYASIGGSSPIYGDTEAVAAGLRKELGNVVTFHRYLPATHDESLAAIEQLAGDKIVVFPMFPQFTYSVTGSIARFLQDHLSPETAGRCVWVKSYSTHPAFVVLMQQMIREFIEQNQLKPSETALLFSAHGLPQKALRRGDEYDRQCEETVARVMEGFPEVLGRLAYQSKFGLGRWLEPSTQELCRSVEQWIGARKNLIFVPISFTSDHLETLHEIEREYMPLVAEKGVKAFRLSAFNRRSDWIETIQKILLDCSFVITSTLVAKNR
ncbi:MAG: Ferrochelatase [Chlamydiae bacterium]|nr:Ferrochelatase [Chlamydiota bacterium]